ncbi:MAG TPA: hypothetical protein VIK60_03745 [Vicinamibacterales bacterium]
MRIEDVQRLEDALERQPPWDPPLGFVRRVVALTSVAGQQWPVRERSRRGGLLRAAAAGLAAATGAYVIAFLLSVLAATVIQETLTAIDSYAAFVELMTRVVAARALHVAWLSAAMSLSFAASLVHRVRA